MTLTYRRTLATAAACTALALFGIAAPAAAAPGNGNGNKAGSSEGPGYGGGADRLHVKWKDKDKEKAQQQGVAVNGVGFRAGSKVLLRIGSGVEVAAIADAVGVLKFDVPTGSGKGLSSGTSVLVSGSSPSGTQLTLVGAIPPEPAGTGVQDAVPWVIAGGLLLAASGGFIGRRRRFRY